MRVWRGFVVAFISLSANQLAFGQNVQNGRQLTERWCLSCHPVSRAQNSIEKPRSLESIANTENVDSPKITQFLLLPHATMPYLPLSHKDAEDIAAYVAQMKK